jgi:hypothetical protein
MACSAAYSQTRETKGNINCTATTNRGEGPRQINNLKPNCKGEGSAIRLNPRHCTAPSGQNNCANNLCDTPRTETSPVVFCTASPRLSSSSRRVCLRVACVELEPLRILFGPLLCAAGEDLQLQLLDPLLDGAELRRFDFLFAVPIHTFVLGQASEPNLEFLISPPPPRDALVVLRALVAIAILSCCEPFAGLCGGGERRLRDAILALGTDWSARGQSISGARRSPGGTIGMGLKRSPPRIPNDNCPH